MVPKSEHILQSPITRTDAAEPELPLLVWSCCRDCGGCRTVNHVQAADNPFARVDRVRVVAVTEGSVRLVFYTFSRNAIRFSASHVCLRASLEASDYPVAYNFYTTSSNSSAIFC